MFLEMGGVKPVWVRARFAIERAAFQPSPWAFLGFGIDRFESNRQNGACSRAGSAGRISQRVIGLGTQARCEENR
jgi:hypothetical protein